MLPIITAGHSLLFGDPEPPQHGAPAAPPNTPESNLIPNGVRRCRRHSTGSSTGNMPARQPQPEHAAPATGTVSQPQDKDRVLSLPPTICEDDPRLDYLPERWITATMGATGLVYRFTDRLACKSNVTAREINLMEATGDLTMRPVSRVIARGNESEGSGTPTAVITELGRPLSADDLAPAQSGCAVVIDMFLLLQQLHNGAGVGRGIVHGAVRAFKFV